MAQLGLTSLGGCTLVMNIRGLKQVNCAMIPDSILLWISSSGFNPFNLVHSMDHGVGFLGMNLTRTLLGPNPPPPFTRAALRNSQ
jgi:hypothetical protein